MAITDYKQYDSRWSAKSYAGGTMSNSGCGPTAVADIIGKTPTEVANWLSGNGFASNGSGTYWEGIAPALSAYGGGGKQLNYASLYGNKTSSVFTQFQNHVKNGYCGILLMGQGYWTTSGHFIAIVGYNNSKYLVYDPASTTRTGYHAWSDFAGQIKVAYTSTVKWSISAGTGSSSSSGAVSGGVTNVGATGSEVNTTYRVSVPQVQYGNTGNVVYLYQEMLKVKGYYSGALDKSFGNETKNATLKFQKDNKLNADAIIGPATGKALLGVGTTNLICPQIQVGARNDYVALLQSILKARGIYSGDIDRSFGSQTKAAVAKYQTLRNLKVDSICGPATWKDLLGM